MAVPSALFILTAMLAAAQQTLLRPPRAAPVRSPRRAIPIALDEPARDAQFDSLLRRGVIVRASPGRYYLDEAALVRERRVRPRAGKAILLTLVVLGGAALLLRVT
ncbi:hypothetical protein [Longimicrobium sp.]|uniref:hypothetical protein n=1 Tax=Longimicrobium sp. TaxID=2029185 RepID=UPI002E31C9AD|nr:hypothetical protein [Longimicrobium sp.]HEX6040371.1 hypothetical protein [Longimicrobium sp.]